MKNKLLKVYSLIIVAFYSLISTGETLINSLLALPIIFDLITDIFSLKKSKRANRGLKIYSLTLILFYIASWLVTMIDYILYGEKSGYFIFGIGVYAVFFVIPVAYCFAKDIFDENRLVKNIFYIVMLIYLLYLAFAVITE
tara:strand:+ start:1268 stop:1690 length:423 start_codon:yes stop_codon:yes gene_type:complete